MRSINELGGDHLYTDFRVYIEGIEVPFSSASVTTAMGDLPRATVYLPPYDGMVEIGKNYYPKVHIFYRDFNEAQTPYDIAKEDSVSAEGADYSSDVKADQASREAYKQIFSGVAINIGESKSIGGGGANAMVTLECVHPLYILQEIALTFFGLGIEGLSTNGSNVDGSVKSSLMGSGTAFTRILQGIEKGKVGVEKKEQGKGPVGDINGLPRNALDRFEQLQGIPGAIVALWNTIKFDAYNLTGTTSSEAAEEMYIPLVEEGLKMFIKMTGHPFLESAIQGDRMQLSGVTDPTKGSMENSVGVLKIISPPFAKTAGFATALMAEMVQSALQEWMSAYQKVSFANLVAEFLNFCHYSIAFLSSPAIKGDGSTVETIVKPNMPFYYSPICNVILPYMYDSFSINFSNFDIPSRMVFMSGLEKGDAGNTPVQLQYLAPHSVRIKQAANLNATMMAYTSKVGVYEWGTGIRPQISQFPMWYSLLNTKHNVNNQRGNKNTEADTHKQLNTPAESDKPAASTSEEGIPVKIPTTTVFEWDKAAAGFSVKKLPTEKQEEIASYGKAYAKAYPKGQASMNPWGTESGLSDNQRMGFAIADKEYAMSHAQSRTGQVNCVFNPYIIAGYPMDIIDPSPQRDSYHGFCSSVTHSIDASGFSSTTVGMASAMTYTELASCFIPAVDPWLAQVLGLDEDPRIFSNMTAYKIACRFYGEVLGVGAANPVMLQDLNTGEASPVTRKGGVWDVGSTDHAAKDGIDTAYNLYYSTLGNLNLVARNIVSLPTVERDYCEGGQKFVDISMWHVSDKVEVQYVHNYTRTELEQIREKAQTGGWELISVGTKLTALEKTEGGESPTGIAEGFREIEASPFLTYDKITPVVIAAGQPTNTVKLGDLGFEPSSGDIPPQVFKYLVAKEDFIPHPYDDGSGYATIGYGCRFYEDGTPVRMSDPAIDQTRAVRLMEYRVRFNVSILRNIPYWDEMDSNKRTALISFSYNAGEYFYYRDDKFRTINTALRTKDWANVPVALKLYNRSGGKVSNGLVQRRAEEGQIWMGQGPYAE